MITKRTYALAALVAASLLTCMDRTQAQGYMPYSPRYSTYTPDTQYRAYSSYYTPQYSNGPYGVRTSSPWGIDSAWRGVDSGFRYQGRYGYSNGYGYRGYGNSFGGPRYNSYPSRSGVSIQLGSGVYGRRGFGLLRGF